MLPTIWRFDECTPSVLENQTRFILINKINSHIQFYTKGMYSKLFNRFKERLERYSNKSKINLNKSTTRTLFADSIKETENTLEIGPFHNPICVGKNVRYFDIRSQEELIEIANQSVKLKHRSSKIPYIEYVSPTGDLTIIADKFDVVVSSHVVEHQLDLIKHLQDVSDLLYMRGKYYLIIPDKRYCFDHFNNKSTIADVLAGHIEKKARHSVKSVIEHRALTTHNDPIRHWKGDHGIIDNSTFKIKNAILENEKEDNIDVHAWYFTPKSFSKIIHTLQELEYIDFIIHNLYSTSHNSLEFYVVLEKVSK